MKSGVRITLTPTVCATCGQPVSAEARGHGGFILKAPMVLKGARSWNCEGGVLTLDRKPVTKEKLASLLKEAK